MSDLGRDPSALPEKWYSHIYSETNAIHVDEYKTSDLHNLAAELPSTAHLNIASREYSVSIMCPFCPTF